MWFFNQALKRNIVGFITALGLLSSIAESAVLTFDDLSPPYMTSVPNGYGSLNWSNMEFMRAATTVPSGYQNSVVSGSNIAYNAYGEMAAASDGFFDFTGAYFTGGWRDGLNIQLKGYSGTQLLYDTTFTVNSTGPTWYQAGFSGIDKLEFHSYGGVLNVNYTNYGDGANFGMDNFTYNVSSIPIPAAVWLFGSCLGLLGWLRRRQAA